MKIPTWAGFIADFPDDQVEEDGDITVFGGRNLAVALGEIFASLGCDRISEPWIAGDVGWEFDFRYRDRTSFVCRVQSFHPVFWLLLEGSADSGKGAEAWLELWRKFRRGLERDPRFHKIIWRSFEEGPPDWDEVEAASDPPGQTFNDESRPVEISHGAPKRGCLSALVGGYLIFWGAGLTIRGIVISDPKESMDDIYGGLPILVMGLLIFYWSKIGYLLSKLRSPTATPR